MIEGEREIGYVYVAVTAKFLVFSCVVEEYRASVCEWLVGERRAAGIVKQTVLLVRFLCVAY